VAIPALVLTEQLVSGRRLRLKYLPLLLWGYLQYRLSGEYRIKRAGGPPGMSQGFPDEIVTDGIYGITRNPMYLGHIIFLGGLTLMTRSPIALAIVSSVIPWYRERARKDEERLEKKFGPSYSEYRDSVPRWVPIPQIVKDKISKFAA
jgi:protein-S-isoprenylcysteine O-methyltransferase Ste14